MISGKKESDSRGTIQFVERGIENLLIPGPIAAVSFVPTAGVEKDEAVATR